MKQTWVYVYSGHPDYRERWQVLDPNAWAIIMPEGGRCWISSQYYMSLLEDSYSSPEQFIL